MLCHVDALSTLFVLIPVPASLFFFFFNDTATTEIYTLSLHDAFRSKRDDDAVAAEHQPYVALGQPFIGDRKSTRLNSSHRTISYAVFCLKKKKNKITTTNEMNTLNTTNYYSDQHKH